MTFEVVAACVHVVDHTDRHTCSLYETGGSKLWPTAKINSVVPGPEHCSIRGHWMQGC